MIHAIGDGRDFKMEQPITVKGKILVVRLKIVMIAQLPSNTVKLAMRVTLVPLTNAINVHNHIKIVLCH